MNILKRIASWVSQNIRKILPSKKKSVAWMVDEMPEFIRDEIIFCSDADFVNAGRCKGIYLNAPQQPEWVKFRQPKRG